MSDPKYPSLFRVDRDVAVYAAEALRGSCRERADHLPLWVPAEGVRIEAYMPGRQIAWLRRSDGGWLAVVTVLAASGNKHSRVMMTLWLDPSFVSTDLSLVKPPSRRTSMNPPLHGQSG